MQKENVILREPRTGLASPKKPGGDRRIYSVSSEWPAVSRPKL